MLFGGCQFECDSCICARPMLIRLRLGACSMLTRYVYSRAGGNMPPLPNCTRNGAKVECRAGFKALCLLSRQSTRRYPPRNRRSAVYGRLDVVAMRLELWLYDFDLGLPALPNLNKAGLGLDRRKFCSCYRGEKRLRRTSPNVIDHHLESGLAGFP